MNAEIIVRERFDEQLTDLFGRYTKAVADRTLPDPRDGLKTVHRRILYAMYELGLEAGKLAKFARVVGDTMGKYHPHGDSSIYEGAIRMSQEFSLRYMLVDYMGNNGSIDGDDPAGMRYVEGGLTRFGSMLLENTIRKKDVVDFTLNFDDTEYEPVVLGGAFPNLLVNGLLSIAVGVASTMPTHNLSETADMISYLIKHPDTKVEKLATMIRPDLPTGGVIKGDFNSMYMKGKGSFVNESIIEHEISDNGKEYVIIKSIPFLTKKSEVIKEIERVIAEGKLKLKEADEKDRPELLQGYMTDMLSVEDNSGMVNGESSARKNNKKSKVERKRKSELDTIRIRIEIRPNTVESVLQYLNKPKRSGWTTTKHHVQFHVLHKGKPMLMNLKDLCMAYIDHQKDVQTRLAVYDLSETESRIHLLRGIITVLDDMDRAIKIIRQSDDEAIAIDGLMNALGVDRSQAENVLSLRLTNLTKLRKEDVKKELQEKMTLANSLKEFLSNEELLALKILDDLDKLKKVSDKRRTIVVE